MSMYSEPDEFQELRRLLAVKRYEQPPPGYFNHFSREVIGRIRTGEPLREPSPASRFLVEFPLLERLWSALETKPIMAGAFGVAICGFLTAGFLFSDNSTLVQTAPVGVLMPEANQVTAVQIASPPAMPFLSQAPGLMLSDTGGVDSIQVRASLFRQPQARMVNFTLPNGN